MCQIWCCICIYRLTHTHYNSPCPHFTSGNVVKENSRNSDVAECANFSQYTVTRKWLVDYVMKKKKKNLTQKTQLKKKERMNANIQQNVLALHKETTENQGRIYNLDQPLLK